MSKNKQMTVYVDESILKRYQEMYPYTLTPLIRKFLSMVIKDKNLFQKIFFSEV